MKAVLLVAGRGKRLCNHTKIIPKSLLKVANKPILFHIVDRILANGIIEFVVVVGFKKEMIIDALKKKYPKIDFVFVENEIYDKTNTLYSLFITKDQIKEDFLYFNADVMFNKNILKKLLNEKYKNGAVVEPHKESMEVFGFDGIITKISKKKDAVGKALGIYKFSKEAAKKLFEESEKIIKSGNLNSYHSAGVNPTIVHHRMDLISTDGMSWIEVDEEEDLLDAERVLAKIVKEEHNGKLRKRLSKNAGKLIPNT